MKSAPWYAWLLPVGLLASLWLVGVWGTGHHPAPPPPSPAQATATTAAETPTSGLVSPAGRLHVGTSLYLHGDYIGTVRELTRANPETGASERGVLYDGGWRDNYRPEWAIIENYQVMAEEKPAPGISAAQWKTMADEAKRVCDQWHDRADHFRQQIDGQHLDAVPVAAKVEYRYPYSGHSDREKFEHYDAQGRAWRDQATALEKRLAAH